MNPKEWEQECVQNFLRWHEAGGAEQMRAWERTLKGVRLEGEPPETRLIVDFHDANDGCDLSLEFELWSEEFETTSGGRDSPRAVGTVISTQATDPAWPLRDQC